jgi:hypothetical protein
MREVKNRTVSSRKSMLTVFWNSHGFHLVTILLPRPSFHVVWLIDGNLIPLLDKFFPAEWNARERKLVMHMDNAPIYNSRVTQDFFGHNPVKILPHPPYSPDIWPLDFYLFGKVKSALIGRETPDEIDLLEAITQIVNRISGAELQCVFRN